MGAPETASRSVTHPAVEEHVAASTQSQAFSALLFLYRGVLHKELYVFPSDRLTVDPRSGAVRRHHLDENGLQKAVRRMAQRAGIVKPVGPHTLRHCFATHLLENHCRRCTVQELLCHKHVKTTMIYNHVLNRGGLAVRSPLD